MNEYLLQAFVTCAIGIEKVGLIMIVFGAVDALFSLLLAKIVEWWTGRAPMMFMSAFVNLSLLIIFSLWEPNATTFYVYFVGAALWGFSDAVWQTQVNGMLFVYLFICLFVYLFILLIYFQYDTKRTVN